MARKPPNPADAPESSIQFEYSEISISPLFSYLGGRYWTSTSHDRSGLVYASLGYTEEYKDLAYYFTFNYYGITSQGSGNIDYNAKAKGS